MLINDSSNCFINDLLNNFCSYKCVKLRFLSPRTFIVAYFDLLETVNEKRIVVIEYNYHRNVTIVSSSQCSILWIINTAVHSLSKSILL